MRAHIVTILCASPLAAGALLLGPGGAGQPPAVAVTWHSPDDIEFNRDVRPILAQHCLPCHGPDAASREAGLRLDVRADALEIHEEGAAIIPGDPARSLVMKRVTSPDESYRMPPAEESGRLSEPEIAILREWIGRGAPWETHWSFETPTRPNPPASEDPWIQNPIDSFVLERLESEGLKPSPPADRRTAIRRVSLDLTGLPPSPEAVDRFLADERPDAYERVVRDLLDSEHYGERMAVRWLDLARYADTNGYSIDGGRHMWAWRDWVIDAFNDNMPFDRFTMEQLAGDLLPDADTSQRIASGFNRNHMITHEGGTILEEYRVAYVADRVKTTAQTWMGLTLGCAQCHDHKYDPISQVDYYRFFAFFNTITDRGNDGNGGINSVPFMPVYSESQRLQIERLELERDGLLAALAAEDPAIDQRQAAWEARQRGRVDTPPALTDWMVSGPYQAATGAEAFASEFAPEPAGRPATESDAEAPRWEARPDLDDGVPHALSGSNSAWYLRRTIVAPKPTPLTLSLGSDDAIKAWLNGELVLDNNVQRGVQPDQERVEVDLVAGNNELLLKIVNYGGPAGFYFRSESAGPPVSTALALAKEADQRSAGEALEVRAYFRSIDPELEAQRVRIAGLTAEIESLESAPLTTVMVMEEMPDPRETRVLARGRYDLPGELVESGTPSFLPQPRAEDGGDRLALARWLTEPEHPLTARVAVNGYWQMLFGTGLVKTSEDFGSRGDRPSHPELLDWLAIEFIESGWDVKEMIYLLVTSSTYLQSSDASARLVARDPENRLLARGPRFRLDGEFIRDLALSASGLLVDRVGGKSVRPYQPPGLWKEMSHFGSTPATEQVYVTDSGDSLYRRSMYTIWKRTVPPPTMAAFDAPSRELCTVRRSRTNTPIQALVLLNEPGFVEAARAIAQRMMTEAAPTPEAQLDRGFVLVTARPPAEEEKATLLAAFERERATFASDPDAALALLTVGESPRDESLDQASHAAWTVIASILLNLSETVTKG